MSAGSLLKLGMFHAYLKMDVLLPQDLFYALHYAYQYLLVYISVTSLGLLLAVGLGFPNILFAVFIYNPIIIYNYILLMVSLIGVNIYHYRRKELLKIYLSSSSN